MADEVQEVDLRAAINAVSDVVQNRPRPLREFDQIYMKTGDMVYQSEAVASWADGRRLAFIGDGDAIGVSVAYLGAREVLGFGPSTITVFDFDERIVGAVKRFADKERIENLDAVLYNVLDPFPETKDFDLFYTNPPWGASNEGESANVFIQRGLEAIRYDGQGLIVVADDDELDWPSKVLANIQRYTAERGFHVSRMDRKLHAYHLDDAPDLRSCNLFISSVARPEEPIPVSESISSRERLKNFYGRSLEPRVHYIRERKKPDYGKAPAEEYKLDLLDEGDVE